jgi:hypothetical protein
MSKQRSYSRRAAALNEIISYVSQTPIPVHGNWCGPNYGSGSPIDELDRLCQEHDSYYTKGDYLNGDKLFVSSLSKDATSKARAIAFLFQNIIIPMRQYGLLTAGSSTQLIALATNMSRKMSSFSDHTGPWIVRQPSSYKTFAAEKVNSTVTSIPNLLVLWKDGSGTVTQAPTSGATSLGSPTSWVNFSGDRPQNTTQPQGWTVSAGVSQIFHVRMRFFNILPTVLSGYKLLYGYSILTADAVKVDAHALPVTGTIGSYTYYQSSLYHTAVGTSTTLVCEFDLAVVSLNAPLTIYPYISPSADSAGDFSVNNGQLYASYAIEGLSPTGGPGSY